MSVIGAPPSSGGDEGERAGAHPLRTETLHGHTSAELTMLDAFRSGRLHHAWLIGGPEGVGKATLAWHFARFVLAHPDPGAETVQSATRLTPVRDSGLTGRLVAGSHGNLTVLERQWNEKTKKRFSDIRVDDVRHSLGLFQRASGSGGYRVCIIDSAEDLNRSSANALLKVIEEPPPRSLFLIVTHRPGQVMPTLVSRARRLMLPALGEAEMLAALRGLGLPENDEMRRAAARARGSVGEALRLLGGEAFDVDEAAEALLAGLPDVDWRRVHRLADMIGVSDDRLATALRAVYRWLEAQVQRHARAGPRSLAAYAEAWAAIRAAAREADVLNLDKRPLLLTVFADLARASR